MFNNINLFIFTIKKRSKIIMIVAYVIISFLVLYNLLKVWFIPISNFSIKQDASRKGDFVKTSIIFNNQRYVCDYDEFSLDTMKGSYGELIARDKEGDEIYKITGQDKLDYVLFVDRGEMPTSSIFRKESIPAINYSNMGFDKVQVNNVKVNITNKFAKDIINSLNKLNHSNLTIKPQNVYELYLISHKLKGMAYCVGIYKRNSDFYFAERGYDKCVKVSDIFTSWLKSKKI